ncbi:MAG: hypothetical protein H7145_09120, partial [Akkermansiaceae bacterium]|nr:hypothetical protein [Armatimonadota bacterium]
MPRSSFHYALCLPVSLAIVSALSTPSLAQVAVPSSAPQSTPATKSVIPSLDLIRYDPKTSGPLLAIGSPRDFMTTVSSDEQRETVAETLGKMTARQFAERSNRRLFTQDTLTLIAARDQRIIADVPQKSADPFAKMSSRERLSVFMSLLSREQWKAATGEKGIGAEEMTDEQRTLWFSLLPGDKITLQKNHRISTGDRSFRYEREGEPQEFAPDTVRIRLVRRIELLFEKVGVEDSRYSTSTDGPVGSDPDTVYTGNFEYTPDERQPTGKIPVQAFGATVLQTVPNRLKKGDLDFASPAFNAALPLTEKTETVSELIERVGKRTGFNLRCDKRVGDLMVYRRVTPGGTVSAGDLLQAVCLSVCGTFRKISPATGEKVYLLTHDTEGINARFLRWSDWAEEAVQKKYDAVEGASKKTALVNPLSMIGFAPNDPNALPPALLARVDAAYQKERYGAAPEFKMSELPPGLRKQAQTSLDWWAKKGTALKTDTLRVGTELTCQLLLPGGIAVEPSSYGRDFGGQYLQKIAVVAKPGAVPQPTKGEPPAKPVPLPRGTGRRVLLLPFPTETNEVEKLLRTAQRKGFTDVWLRIPLQGDEKRTERLQVAVKSGTRIGLRVGAIVDVLRGYKGIPDVNTLGETGDAFTKRTLAKHPERDYYASRFPGWNIWDENVIKSGLVPLASVPGLSALALQATAAPGHAGIVQGGDGIPSGGHLGYTVAMRLACLDANGFDPIDAGDYSHALGLRTEVGLFTANALWDEFTTFRWKQNKREMARMHAVLKNVAPKLPVYLNDRASSYTSPNSSWYVRWAQADRIAVCPVHHVESGHREVALAVSPEAFLNQWGWSGQPSDFANAV